MVHQSNGPGQFRNHAELFNGRHNSICNSLEICLEKLCTDAGRQVEINEQEKNQNMKIIAPLLIFLTTSFVSCSQKYNYPGQLELSGYKIGDKVDTTVFKKY